MDAGKSSPLSSFKSKKTLHSPVPADHKTRKDSNPDPNPWSVKTPGKPADPPRRSRQTGAALSIKEIREAALRLRGRGSKPRDRTDPILGSGKEQTAKVEQKSVDSEIKLPEKYELLDEFFNSLDSSIRLLRLKRYPTTFTNIRPQIESLTERRFTHSHLAQLKFIMPEAILIEIVRQRDEQTGIVKPDLLITLSFEVIDGKSKSKSHSKNLQLRKIFRDRLLDFFKSHPEGDEVPEGALPEPFNSSKEETGANSGCFSGREECSLCQGSSSHSILLSPLPETPVKCTSSIEDENQRSLLRTPADLASTPAKLMRATPLLQPPKRCYMSPEDN
ncbi:hypothetical protein CDL12_01689 [Handroanthus impetiginosus]|uniref:CDT1 Geminin-binding domain-containing protein n=1 Tax=Handroanthus impetiginosus TaxID=429701 RepID=A0A2G9I746_9LAMI|nr:hypothetical protein CDL12_01689 [Handroanthus impetiginosus]